MNWEGQNPTVASQSGQFGAMDWLSVRFAQSHLWDSYPTRHHCCSNQPHCCQSFSDGITERQTTAALDSCKRWITSRRNLPYVSQWISFYQEFKRLVQKLRTSAAGWLVFQGNHVFPSNVKTEVLCKKTWQQFKTLKRYTLPLKKKKRHFHAL